MVDLIEDLGDVIEMTSDRRYEFEVALSFAGEDRSHASKLANILRRRGVKVFFDEYEKHTLWGKNLYIHLSEIYQNKARYINAMYNPYSPKCGYFYFFSFVVNERDPNFEYTSCDPTFITLIDRVERDTTFN